MFTTIDHLRKIEKTLLTETIIDREILIQVHLRRDGGFVRINKIFSGELEGYLQELNDYLYADGGETA